MTILIETKYYESSKCLKAKGPSCVTVEINLYANIPKCTKRSNREIQTSSNCNRQHLPEQLVFVPKMEWRVHDYFMFLYP